MRIERKRTHAQIPIAKADERRVEYRRIGLLPPKNSPHPTSHEAGAGNRNSLKKINTVTKRRRSKIEVRGLMLGRYKEDSDLRSSIVDLRLFVVDFRRNRDGKHFCCCFAQKRPVEIGGVVQSWIETRAANQIAGAEEYD